jgi:hypothetical protein
MIEKSLITRRRFLGKGGKTFLTGVGLIYFKGSRIFSGESNALPKTVCVENALNSRTSATIVGGGNHYCKSASGKRLDKNTIRDVLWSASKIYDFCPEIKLKNYAFTPYGNYFYNPINDKLDDFTGNIGDAYVPDEKDGGINVFQTLEGVDIKKINESPHFDAIYKLGSSYMSLELLCAGYYPLPLATCNWGSSKRSKSGPYSYIIDNPKEINFENLPVVIKAPSWNGDSYYAPGIHPNWDEDPLYGTPSVKSNIFISEAIANFSFSERISSKPLSNKDLSQLMFGCCGSTYHDYPKNPNRLIGTCYPSSTGSYYIRTDDAKGLAYIINSDGLLKYLSITENNLPTSSFKMVVKDSKLKTRLEKALNIKNDFSPLYVLFNDYKSVWTNDEIGSWAEITEAASAEFCLRMQVYSMNLAMKTFILNTAEKRKNVKNTSDAFVSPLVVSAVGYKD